MRKKKKTITNTDEVVSTSNVESAEPVKTPSKRAYSFALVIYEDDINFSKQYEALTNLKRAIWIKHDKDVYEDDVLDDDGKIVSHAGDLKKPHYHFVLHLKYACTITALANKVCCETRQIEFVKKSLNGYLRYLIHFNNDNKYQYGQDEVKSNDEDLKRKFENLISEDIPEVKRVEQIQDIIEGYSGYLELGILGKTVQKMNIWDAFRRNLTYFIKLVDLHNAKLMGLNKGQKDLEYSVYSSCKGDYDE